MTTERIKIELNSTEVNAFLAATMQECVKRAAGRAAERANRNVIAKGRVRTGALSKSYVPVEQPGTNSDMVTYDVASPLDYAGLQEEGAGPSVAKPGGILRFQPKGSSVYVFRRRTKGFAGAHQLRDALKDLSFRDFLP